MRQRGVLNPVEQARACDTLMKELGLTQREIGERVGRSTSGVANLMRLLDLSEETLELIGRGELGMAHGLALLVAKDPEVRRDLARKAAKEGWTVLALEARARESNGAGASSPQQDIHRAATIAWATALGAITAEARRRLASVDIRRHSETRSHFPDIVIWPPAEPGESPPLPIAVEVELTMKSKEELVAICRAWARCRHIEAVLYFAETVNIENRLLDTIERLKAEEMIVVNPLSEIVKSLPGFDLAP
jgi:transcriptional regulator with XRE-family HTH domain